jgi:hypothetical protein
VRTVTTSLDELLSRFDSLSLPEIEAACRDLKTSERIEVARRIEYRLAMESTLDRQRLRDRKRRIRSMTPKGKQSPCFVCGGFKYIAVRHHIVPVAKSDPRDPEAYRVTWLCPNCHAIVHRVMEVKTVPYGFADLLSPDQWQRVESLVPNKRFARQLSQMASPSCRTA